ncbi:uncharacterized protein LOC130440998 [Diorhabda sublineata]|uniref:uncharacterized protein LOC130440998 n=1 Tax=Diorhabda sublineata TaxID=1163346 RepID=UPI0024E056F9|nr:uncharacterized protein LOC130440998 [Diorhabda sublineata]
MCSKIIFFLPLVLLLTFISNDSTQALSINKPHEFRSDVVQTHWPTDKKLPAADVNEEDQPGFWRKQLVRFGEVASKVGNSVGSSASSITRAIDKVCEVVKTVIPLLAAVCHVGQFKFCAATTGAPDELNTAINNGYADLNLPD